MSERRPRSKNRDRSKRISERAATIVACVQHEMDWLKKLGDRLAEPVGWKDFTDELLLLTIATATFHEEKLAVRKQIGDMPPGLLARNPSGSGPNPPPWQLEVERINARVSSGRLPYVETTRKSLMRHLFGVEWVNNQDKLDIAIKSLEYFTTQKQILWPVVASDAMRDLSKARAEADAEIATAIQIYDIFSGETTFVHTRPLPLPDKAMFMGSGFWQYLADYQPPAPTIVAEDPPFEWEASTEPPPDDPLPDYPSKQPTEPDDDPYEYPF